MRALVLVFSLVAAAGLAAQEAPKDLSPKQMREYLRGQGVKIPPVTAYAQLPGLRIAEESPPCSIPLVQVNPVAEGLTPVIPAPDNRGTIVMMDPPAPPCDSQSKLVTRWPDPNAPHSIEVTPERRKP